MAPLKKLNSLSRLPCLEQYGDLCLLSRHLENQAEPIGEANHLSTLTAIKAQREQRGIGKQIHYN